MKAIAPFVLLGATLISPEMADGRTIYEQYSVENSVWLIGIDPLEDNLFSITLRDKATGFERRHEFQGEGANDPSPFLLGSEQYCGTWVIMLTIEFPWRHALPQYIPILDTYAFREEDFEFIDVVMGPLTDIALQDDIEAENMLAEMLPPVGVHCLADPAAKPFRFFRREPQ